MTDEILTHVEHGVGRITLNRPKALHALNRGMCEAMLAALLAWREDDRVRSVIIDHAGERGFCAGGDIRMLAESGATDGVDARAFFYAEYRLNHLLFEYPKPVTAIIDGIVMGGGVGISLPAKVRIATERTTFAMPETGIGLFPDVGGGWFLPRLPEPELGTWLALTGARLKGRDTVSAGIATHYVESADLPGVKAALLRGDASVLDGLATEGATIMPELGALVPLFGHDTVEAIFAALEADGRDWPMAQLAILRTRSPQSMKVSLRQLRTGASLPSFADNMAMEYALAGRIVATHDFQEGVRAVIVDKDNAPRWSPAELTGVTDEQVEGFFAPLPPGEEWTPVF
ncbi:enoyl-CoA hydratase [Brevundimonas sp. Leaf363]|uniref:enoyl-CoA hydratase/isomerase family protein n=1 Tax=Brevundimonas sp. Leaf363 TaxID=1736353 RepID=UPI0006F2D167|nr:enoyl-CoA hydratase/isomerase family protein [Brevundimonas sp. Leaf363]KQS56207.1 enoyl-CoA hydratase [Brevundimonas sp. Leaf363]